MKKILFVIISILFFASCFYFLINIINKNKQKSFGNRKIKIVTSIYPLAEFTKEIGKDLVDVDFVTPPGAEPHDYEPTPQDIVRIRSAGIFLFNGNGMDIWAQKITDDLSKNDIIFLDMSKALGLSGNNDPHFWLDPSLVKKEIEIIKDILIKTDSLHAIDYQKNSMDYLALLDKLDSNFRQGLANCRQNEIIVSHNAFSYLAKRYNIRTNYISGLSPDEEPSIKRISEVTTIAKNKNIRYIFFEKLVNPKISETIAKEVGAQTLLLDPFEGLTKEEIDANKNYLSVMKENLDNLRLALSCI